ncbi:hypothetical protein [Mesorhizobium sp.]|nr:hypothetical protein [Mesorhizobium sp.]
MRKNQIATASFARPKGRATLQRWRATLDQDLEKIIPEQQDGATS